MANWIETKITYDKLQENGVSVKKTTESYLVDALSFTEAEARIIEERTPYVTGEFSVQAVKKTKISEVFHQVQPVDEKFYIVKWNIISLDEKSGAEKKISCQTLVGAANFRSVLAIFDREMDGCNLDYEIVAVAETAILDIYPAKTETNG